MARWEPDPEGRLLRAALDLFEAEGYAATTTAQLAERAGLTRATVFRLFADKREILFQGQDASVRTVQEVAAAAPADAEPVDVVRSVLRGLSETHRPEQQEVGRRIDALLATSPELRERAAFKRSTIGAALERGLIARGADRAPAGALADLGVRAYYDAFTDWTLAGPDAVLADLVLARFDGLLAGLAGVLGAVGRTAPLSV